MPVAVPRPAGLLRGPVPREGPDTHGACGQGSVEVLAEDVQPEGGDVPRGDRGGAGRHRAVAVHSDPGAAVQADREMRLQPTLPGSCGTLRYWLKQ